MGLLAAAGGPGPGVQPAGGHLGPAGMYAMSCQGHAVPGVSFPGGVRTGIWKGKLWGTWLAGPRSTAQKVFEGFVSLAQPAAAPPEVKTCECCL